MQVLFRNSSSLGLRLALLVAGIAALGVAAADYFAVWPLFGVNQNLDLTLLLAGSAAALIGLKETAGFVKEIDVDVKGNILIGEALGRRTLAAGSLRTLIIYAAGKDKRRLTLVADGGSLSFPTTAAEADGIADTIKAINPSVEVERRQ